MFLLVLCVTGLPLIFRDELSAINRPSTAAAQAPSTNKPVLVARAVDLDALIQAACGPSGRFPGETVRWISLEVARPEIWIALAPTYQADRRLNHVVKFDAATGHLLETPPSIVNARPTFLGVVLKLHSELLAGDYGEWFLAFIGLMLLVATVSGVVVYGPSVRKLEFGAMRRYRGKRIRWLDLHNLLGISTTAWVIVVGATGVLNEIADPAYERWRVAALATALKPYAGEAMPQSTTSVQAAVELVRQANPATRIRSVRFPDSELGSPHHFLIWTIGSTPLTAKLFTPALVDARTGRSIPIDPAPWYLKAVQLSRPLHFGDYGGLPLKILWAVLDLITIVVLISGLCLWWLRRSRAG